MAKTVMGSYSANDMMEHLKGQQLGGPAPRPAPGPTPGPSYGAPGPAPSPYQRPAPSPTPGPPPAAMPMPMSAPPAPAPMSHPAHGPTMIAGPGGMPHQPQAVPIAASAAPTLFVPGGGAAAPQGGFPGGGPGARPMAPQPQPYPPPATPYNAGPSPAPGMPPAGQPGMQPPAPMLAPMPMPQPAMTPPYLSAQATHSARPIEPWKDSLRLMMFLWGGALLLVFVTPLTLDPPAFHWDAIIHSAGKEKLPSLIVAAVGLLSIVLALIPTSPAPRGLIAGTLGLVGIALPFVLAELTAWQALVPLAGSLLLIPGLLIREEYRESILPRIMVTLGAIAVLLPILLPENSQLPLVELFKEAIDAPGKLKLAPLLKLAYIVVIVLTLLAWLPAPLSGGAKVFAWILLLWPALQTLTALFLADKLVDAVTKAPNTVIAWAAGTAYYVLVGYGFATVIGKKLE